MGTFQKKNVEKHDAFQSISPCHDLRQQHESALKLKFQSVHPKQISTNSIDSLPKKARGLSQQRVYLAKQI